MHNVRPMGPRPVPLAVEPDPAAPPGPLLVHAAHAEPGGVHPLHPAVLVLGWAAGHFDAEEVVREIAACMDVIYGGLLGPGHTGFMNSDQWTVEWGQDNFTEEFAVVKSSNNNRAHPYRHVPDAMPSVQLSLPPIVMKQLNDALGLVYRPKVDCKRRPTLARDVSNLSPRAKVLSLRLMLKESRNYRFLVDRHAPLVSFRCAVRLTT